MNIIYTKNDYSFKIFLYKMDQFFSFSMTLQINSEKCSPNLTSSSLVDGGPCGNILFIEEPFASKPPPRCNQVFSMAKTFSLEMGKILSNDKTTGTFYISWEHSAERTTESLS